MLILAIDTALDACAAGVLDTDAGKLIAQESLPMKRGHAEALMPLIARVTQQSRLPFSAFDRIAVTTGPGSFTGLRVGLSAARGIALAAAKPVVGVTTLTAYAAPVVSDHGEHPVIAAIDARHGQVYFQVVGGDGTLLIPPQVSPIAEALAATTNGTRAILAAAERCGEVVLGSLLNLDAIAAAARGAGGVAIRTAVSGRQCRDNSQPALAGPCGAPLRGQRASSA